MIKGYKPRLHYCSVVWEKPELGKLKCNTDGASRSNPRENAYSFCVRNRDGNLEYAEPSKIGEGSNMEAEIVAMLKALRYFRSKNIMNVIVEKDAKVLAKMIRKEWKVSWQQAAEIEEIQELTTITQAQVKIFFQRGKLVSRQTS